MASISGGKRAWRRGFLLAGALGVLGGSSFLLYGKGGAPPPPRVVDPAILLIVGVYEADPAGPFRTQWDRFASHKADRGLPVEIVKLSDILAGGPYGAPERDSAEKVKNFIRSRKLQNWGTLRYAICGEDFDDGVHNTVPGGLPLVREVFPVRYTALNGPVVGGQPEGPIPATLPYYSDLFTPAGEPATWDSDNDGIFAEPGVDDIDLFANPVQGDVCVGYLPVRSGDADGHLVLRSLVDKVIAYEDPGVNGGQAYPRLEAGHWFMRAGLFGANTWNASDRNGERDCKSIRDVILRVAQRNLPSGVEFEPVEFFLDGRLGPQPVQASTSVRTYCNYVNAGTGFIYSEGHGGNDTSAANNDAAFGASSFPFIASNWTHPAFGGADFTNYNGPFPVGISMGCNMLWTDPYAFLGDVWWKWGDPCMGEVLATASSGAPNYTPRGLIAFLGASRSMQEDPCFGYGFYEAYATGRASRLGEIYSQAQCLYANRQDLWTGPQWSGTSSRFSGGYYHHNQYMMTYVGDPSLQLPPTTPPQALYEDRAGAAGLGLTTGNVSCAAAADLDGDGRDDLILGASAGSPWRVKILRRDPASGFVEEGTAGDASDEVLQIAVGDVNGDGRLDLFCANEGTDRLLLGGPGWTFTDASAAWGVSGTARTTRAVLADLDADGRTDLATIEAGSLRVWRNTGASLAERTTEWGMAGSANATALAVADYNADRLPDLFVGANPTQASRFYVGITESSWIESYARVVSGALYNSWAEGADFSDLDGDGDLDLHLQLSDTYEQSGGSYVSDRILEQTSDGRLVLQGETPSGLNYRGRSAGVAMGDLNLDGKDDAVFFTPFGARLTANRWEWSFVTRPHDDGFDMTERMRGGCLVDAGAGYPDVLGLRHAGHAGTHPYGALRYWVRRDEGGIVGPNRWIRLRLHGAGTQGLSSPDAIGARATVVSNNDAGGMIRSTVAVVQGDDRSSGLTVGLQQDSIVESVTVEWPSGVVQDVDVGELNPVGMTLFVTEQPEAGSVRPSAAADLSAAVSPDWNEVRVTWSANPAGEGVDHYEVWRSVNGGGFLHHQAVPWTGQPAYLFAETRGNGVEWGNTYQYRVRAVNAWGRAPWGAVSQSITFEPRPAPPQDFGVVQYNNANHLNWAPVAGPIVPDYYRVYRQNPGEPDFQPISGNLTPSDRNIFVDPTGDPQRAVYKVAAGNAFGEQFSAQGTPAPYSAIRIDPIGRDLVVPAGSRYQLRAFMGDFEFGGTAVVTYLCTWTSSNPQIPISPPDTGGLQCNGEGQTMVTATWDTQTAQKTYNVIFQAPLAPPGGPKGSKAGLRKR